jgi:pimeloyl-ACP methyl ester carboxylesterase
MPDIERFRKNPHLRGFVFLIEAQEHAQAGRSEEALDTLERALSDGCRYRREWLDGDPRLAALRSQPRYEQLAERSAARYAEDAAAARPHLMFAIPDELPDAFGYPLLMVLHGNNSNSSETAPHWTALADAGWVVAVPQSSEIGATPGSFVWNDRERTAQELDVHLERVKRATSINVGNIVLAGFSMGGTQAIALALTRRIKVRGIFPIAAWLPNVKEFRALVEGAPNRMLRAYGIVGDKDESVEGARELFDVFGQHKMRSELEVRPGLGHEYPDDMRDAVLRAVNFITRP